MTTASAPPAARRGPRLSRGKKASYALVVLATFCLGVEVLARVGAYLYYDRNPYYLLYGYRSWTDDEGEGHSRKLAGYFKFPGDVTIEYGTPGPCRINGMGFRGPGVAPEKPAGGFRIVCLGASSTFGYLNLDEETYPRRLELLLREEHPDVPVEVLNAGIPHFTTDHILAALRGELLDLEPDLLTLYTGCNDAVRPLAEGSVQRLGRTLDEYSAAYATLRKLIEKATGAVLFGQWTPYTARMDREAIERQLALHLERTRANLEAILDEAAAHEVPVVLVRQPITTWYDRRSRGLVEEEDPPTTYEDEYRAISDALERDGFLRDFEVPLYVHHHLLAEMDELAAERGLTVVDNVALVAEHPTGLGSKVHLTAEGNRRLAGALAEGVKPYFEGTRYLGAETPEQEPQR